jgi:Rrf2 family cysteine metabolism transcriptional repressor
MRTTLFSKKAEYACLAMLELAAQYHEPAPIRLNAIADAHRISRRFLVQILLQLKAAGLVTSVRGAAGGYQLSRPPEHISLASVLNVVDRPEKPETEKAGSDGDTPLKRVIHHVWRQIQEEQQRILDDTSLADLVRRSQEHFAPMYQI